MPTCIEGHSSAADDYCDVCGAPIATSAAQPDPSPAAQGLSRVRNAGHRPLL